MSSEEDDDEELLQRALAQQAQRDQSFNNNNNNNKKRGSSQYPSPSAPGISSPGGGAAGASSAAAAPVVPPRRNPPQTPPNRAPPPTGPRTPPNRAPPTSRIAPPKRAPPAPRITPPSRAPPPAPPAMDDEEESDVELLSISSEDEDSRRGSTQKDLSKIGAGASRGGAAAGNESDLDWDGDDEEPESWMQVDQTEMARRVREMRETRASRTAPFLPANTRLRRSNTLVDAPGGSNEELLDPFGLGIINIKTLTLVRDDRKSSSSSAGAAAFTPSDKVGEDEEERTSDRYQAAAAPPQPQEETTPVVRDSTQREKVMYHSEKFEPKFFMASIHQSTAFADLEAGEGALKRDLQNRKDQLKKLVKENFDCFISCKNTIDDIHSKLKQIEADPEGAGTVHLSDSIHSVEVVSKRAFGPLLERQAQAERIRSVQGVLQRFRTLFNLPSIIREHISKGAYDLAIREYHKAKSLVQYTQVAILNRVLEEVDKIVEEFKEMLYKTMDNPNVEMSQLENTIRLLLELEPESDPVWHYLSIQDRRIRGLLEGCSLEHEARMDALQGRVLEKAQSDARWKQLQHELKKTSGVDFNLLLGDEDSKEVGEGQQLRESTAGEEADALLGRLIRRLTVVLVQHVPNFWKLALSIFSGKFVKVTPSSASVSRVSSLSDHEGGPGSFPHEDDRASKYTKHTLDEVVIMVHCILSLYDAKVQNAFVVLANANVLRPSMREALAEVNKACVALGGKDCAPTSAVQALLVFRTDLTRVFVFRVCSLMRAASNMLVHEEDWIPVPTTERGSTSYAISYLPLRFHNMLVRSMEHMTQLIQQLTSEPSELLEDVALPVQQMQDSVRTAFVDCFVNLADCLDKLAVEVSQSIPSVEASKGQKPESNTDEEEFKGLISGLEVTNYHQRLLMVLSNTAFCKNSLLTTLLQKYQPIWTYSSTQRTAKGMAIEESNGSTTEEAFNALSTVEEKILSQYNLAKAAEVGVAAAAYLLDDRTQWGQTPPIKGIRDNVVELMHPLVTVHAEVYSGAKPFLDKVIKVIVEGLMVALLNVFTENKHSFLRILDVNGYCQLTLELDFIGSVLESYFTGAAREAGVGLRDMLLEKVCESVREIQQAENASHSSRRSRTVEDPLHEGPTPMSPDEIQAHAHQISADYLPVALKRARTNVVCFTESLPEYNQVIGRRTVNLQKSGFGRHLLAGSIHLSRKSTGTLSVDPGLPPLVPLGGYASSEVGSDTGSTKGSGPDRFSRLQTSIRNQGDIRQNSRRTLSMRIV